MAPAVYFVILWKFIVMNRTTLQSHGEISLSAETVDLPTFPRPWGCLQRENTHVAKLDDNIQKSSIILIEESLQ